jgi:CRP-like cAMP-binding protein
LVPPRPDAVDEVEAQEDGGESAHVQPRMATVRTVTPTTLLCLSASAYKQMRMAVPSIGMAMDRLLEARVSHGESVNAH